MKRLRVYIDTSVIGDCLDVEFAAESQRLIEAIRNNKVVMLLRLNGYGILTIVSPREVLFDESNES